MILKVNIYTLLYFHFNFTAFLLASNVVDRGFEPWLGQTKDNEIGICCFSAKHTALRRKSKEGLSRNQDNESEWGDISICRLLLQWANTVKIQLSVLL
jgi:hypothetical protein